MARPSPASAQHSIRELTGRTPLRVKLIAAVLALVTVALVVISVAGIAVLRGYLLGQADRDLIAAANSDTVTNIVGYYLEYGQLQHTNGGLSVQWLPASGPVRQVVGEFPGYGSGQQVRMVPPPAVQHGDSWLGTCFPPSHHGFHPITLNPASPAHPCPLRLPTLAYTTLPP